MNRYFLKVHPIKDCVGTFGQSRLISRWEGGEITLKSKGPRFPGKGRTQLAPEIQRGDELWIWTHEGKGGQGLVAKATAASADITGQELRVILKEVVLVPSPFGFDKFRKRPDNGHDTGTQILDYKSINRGTGVYLIEGDDYPKFLEIVEKFGGEMPSYSEANGLDLAAPPSGFSWADEIEKKEDEIISDLAERRLNWHKVRPVQGKFRDALFDLYDEKCVLSRCSVPEAIEAAHVLPHNGDPVRDRPDNGLLLRRDLHTMFDAMLWSIDPKTNKVRLARRLVDKSYAALEGKVVDHHVAPEPLRVHFIQFQKEDKNV